MTDNSTLAIADQIDSLINEFYESGHEAEIAYEIAQHIPLEILKKEGLEALFDVAANIHLNPKRAWLLNESIKCINIPAVIRFRENKKRT